jgi:hypothetical protein
MPDAVAAALTIGYTYAGTPSHADDRLAARPRTPGPLLCCSVVARLPSVTSVLR